MHIQNMRPCNGVDNVSHPRHLIPTMAVRELRAKVAPEQTTPAYRFLCRLTKAKSAQIVAGEAPSTAAPPSAWVRQTADSAAGTDRTGRPTTSVKKRRSPCEAGSAVAMCDLHMSNPSHLREWEGLKKGAARYQVKKVQAYQPPAITSSCPFTLTHGGAYT